MAGRSKKTATSGRYRRRVSKALADGDPTMPMVRTLVLSDLEPDSSVADRLLAETAGPAARAAADRLVAGAFGDTEAA